MFSDRFKELRNSKGLSQKEIAKILNVSPSLIGGWENTTRDPDTETITKICDFFGCSADYILGRTDIMNPLQDISKEESQLIERYRKLDDKEKGNIIGRIELFLEKK